MTQQRAGRDHLAGLDAIRFVAAAIVAVSHFYPSFQPVFEGLGLDPRAARLADVAVTSVFNGQAAVIVFFVLSGFVIHYPYAGGKIFDVREFYARRLLRIVPPSIAAAIAMLAMGLIPDGGWGFEKTLFWSLICETIYYLLYPALLAFPSVRMTRWLGLAGVAAAATVWVSRDMLAQGTNFHELGYATWIVGFPAWLMGCVLAERWRGFPLTGVAMISIVRLFILGMAAVLLVLRNLEEVLGVFASNIVLMYAFAPMILAWLGLEVRRGAAGPAGPVLAGFDWLGRTSYSLYLVHMVAAHLNPSGDRGFAGLAVFALICAAATTIFYLAVERPSHRFARNVGRRFRHAG